MSTSLLEKNVDENNEDNLGGQMSFLEHLDELRSRLIRSIIFIFIALIFCWIVSDRIYDFLERPIKTALANAQQLQMSIVGLSGPTQALPLNSLKEGDEVRYIFARETSLGASVIPLGASVNARVTKDSQGNLGLFTSEQLVAGNTVLPEGVKLPVDFKSLSNQSTGGTEAKLTLTTTTEAFTLYVKVSLYAAICLSVPFLLWQIWGFISPGLYSHERSYAIPFIILSSISFVLGSMFAYYILFPPAAQYLLGLGEGFQLLLNASDYFDFIILIMLAMGVVFQMPAISYVLSRIGIITAGFLIRVWKYALIIILIAAAVLSPTSDLPNMMLFAAPMAVLYVVSIFIAWLFGKPRVAEQVD
jgi:sec-independent protein translocase protein TatC